MPPLNSARAHDYIGRNVLPGPALGGYTTIQIFNGPFSDAATAHNLIPAGVYAAFDMRLLWVQWAAASADVIASTTGQLYAHSGGTFATGGATALIADPTDTTWATPKTIDFSSAGQAYRGGTNYDLIEAGRDIAKGSAIFLNLITDIAGFAKWLSVSLAVLPTGHVHDHIDHD